MQCLNSIIRKRIFTELHEISAFKIFKIKEYVFNDRIIRLWNQEGTFKIP
jgi:hypothetical protein